MGLEALRARALERVAHGLLRLAQVLRVEVAFLVQDLRVAQRDRRPRGPLHLEPRPADHVLAQVHDRQARLRLQDLDRTDLLDPPHGRRCRRDQGVLAVIGELDARPVAIVEAGPGPARLLEARVVGFSVVDLRHQDRAGRGLPAGVAAHDLAAPVRVGHFDLHQQREPVAVDVAPAGEAHLVPAVPAVADERPHGVGARLQERRDVVGLVLEALVVAGPAGSEELVAHALAVQVQLVEAVARRVGARASGRARELELAPQHRNRARLRHVLLERGLDPARLPVGGLDEAHLPPCRCAPGGGPAASVPHANLPVEPLARAQVGTGVRELRRCVGRDATRRPHELAAGTERALAPRGPQLVRGLHHAAPLGLQLPAQARPGSVDPERVLLVLRAQGHDAHARRGGRTRGGWRSGRHRWEPDPERDRKSNSWLRTGPVRVHEGGSTPDGRCAQRLAGSGDGDLRGGRRDRRDQRTVGAGSGVDCTACGRLGWSASSVS